jgi:hypothetical protein
LEKGNVVRRVRSVVRFGCAASMLVGAVTVGAVAEPAAAASSVSWSVVPSANQSPEADLSGVSCTRPAACTAVGAYFAGPSYQTLIESWNGSVWSIVPSPNASANLNYLTGVSCSRPNACTAVGYDIDIRGDEQALIESWDGQVWSIAPNPIPSLTSSLLNGVSCPRPSACTAVGTHGFGQTLIESWNGQVWTVVPSPNVAPTHVDDLNSVSCSRRSACTAVGYDVDRSGAPEHELIESWNGQVWSIVPDPNPSLPSSLLNGVSCLRPSACTAVGTHGAVGQTLIETWNGSVWSVVPSPSTSPTELNDLTGVSCSRRSACTAVGYQIDSSRAQHMLIESWNGRVWSIVPSPDAPPNLINLLTGVSCDRRSGCTAVGSQENGHPTSFHTLIASTTTTR